jgi:uridine phosphorylase
MQREAWPILEHDPDVHALIDPRANRRPLADMPRHAVLCFVRDALERYVEAHKPPLLHSIRTEMGSFPVYIARAGHRPVALAPAGIGAPLAAGILEILIALGARRFVSCGGCGVVDPTLGLGDLLVPTSALRDEGTSYHYLPPARAVEADPDAVATIERIVGRTGPAPRRVCTWTTDAFYRETPARIAARRAEGAACVEMECAAIFAVARFRGVPAASLLYGGDDVSGPRWEHRQWEKQHEVRDRLLSLALESCAAMA